MEELKFALKGGREGKRNSEKRRSIRPGDYYVPLLKMIAVLADTWVKEKPPRNPL
jgi:hypothetical protein